MNSLAFWHGLVIGLFFMQRNDLDKTSLWWESYRKIPGEQASEWRSH